MPNTPDLIFEIVYDGDLYPVVFAPIGWDKINITGEIDEFYGTVWEKINNELKFIEDGADVLRTIFLTKGANATALLRIRKKNEFPIGSYSLKISQQVDFQKYSDLNGVVTVGFLEKGIASNIRTYGDVQYSIPLGDKAVSMNIGGIGVDQFASYIGGVLEQSTGDGNLFVPSLSVTDSTTELEFATTTPYFDPYSGNRGDSLPSFITLNKEFGVRITGHIILNLVYRVTGIRGENVEIRLKDQFGTSILLRTPYLTSNTQNADFTFDVVFPAQIGSEISLYATLRDVNAGAGIAYIRFQTVEIKIQYQQYTDDYTVKGLRSNDLFEALLAKINPDSNLLISAPVLSTGLGNRIVVASGDCIRGLPGATIQTSFKEFISTFRPQLFGALKPYSDESIKFDKLNNIQFNPGPLAGHIGTVSNPNYESITDVYGGSYDVGYPDNSYDKADGRDETNTTVVRTVDGSKAVNDIEIISTYRADPRGVDQLLIDYRADPTRDNTGDKQNFQFVINENTDPIDGLYHLVGPEVYKKVEGTSALGRIYNLDLAPIMMFLRNSAMVAVQFAIEKAGFVKFESSKKNGGLKITKFDDTMISEKMNLSYNQMNPPLYLPIKCTFTAVLSDDQYDKIISSASKTGGYITYTDRGVTFKAFLVSYSYNLTHDNIKEFIVYLHPDTDLTKLINLK